jgi:hypothetical protein
LLAKKEYMPATDELKSGEDYKIRPQTPEEKERLNPEDSEIPSYRIQLKLNEEQKKRLIKQFYMEFNAIKAERERLGLEKKWKERDAQYDGEMAENKTIPFNLHVHQSKIKIDAIKRAIKEAVLDSDPIVDVSPRPDSGRKDGYKIAQAQTEFIDYAMDEEIKPDAALDKIISCCLKKFVGIGKLSWSYRQEKRKREECYEGKNIPVEVVNGRIMVKNEGLEQFLSAYPDGMDRYKGYVKRLLEEKKIEIVVNYNDTVENNAKIKQVKIEDFFVRNSTEYNEGLRTTHCIAEREVYSYWDLKKKEDNEEFEDIEALFNTSLKDGEVVAEEDYQVRDYNALEATMYFALNEGDEEIKVKAWFGEDKECLLGAILYPYYAFDIDYVGFWVELNERGFYGDAMSVMYNLRDSNLAQNVLLNLMLYGLYIRNSITPIAKEGSEVANMFLEKSWTAGVPLIVDELTDDVNKGLGFVQWPSIDMNSYMAMNEMLRRDDSDVTKVSDLTSGRESVVDPTAPASKTIALLQQSGLGVKEYLRTFIPSFNILCTMILQIYYQMSQEGKKYKIRPKAEGVTGGDPFSSISRDQMIVKTNVQARASSFVFDKINEKQEAVAANQLIMTSPYCLTQPAILHESLKTTLETFGARWKNLADKLLNPEEFQKQQMQIAMEAIQALMQQAQQAKEVTGVAPKVGPEEMAGAVTKAQAVAYNPQLAEEPK